jgi:tetratricopeptide (TPR) repeat protein
MIARRALLTVGSFLAVVVAAHSVSAAPPETTEKPPKSVHEEAVRLFDQSRQKYREGHFQEAVKLLLDARALEPAPVLLYNLARAYEGLGDQPHALEAYQAYLDAEHAAVDRGAIEERIRTLQRDIAEHERLERQREEAVERANQERANQERLNQERANQERAREAQPKPSAAARIGLGPSLTAGAGGVVLATGVVLAVVAESAHDGAQAESEQAAAASKQRDAQHLATWANVAFAVGGTAALAGVIWGFLRLRSPTSGTGAVGANLATDGRTVFVNARF